MRACIAAQQVGNPVVRMAVPKERCIVNSLKRTGFPSAKAMELFMFEQQTTIILGAGASQQFGFPVGRELQDEIIEDIGKPQEVIIGITATAIQRGRIK